jgi:hypothetical protein
MYLACATNPATLPHGTCKSVRESRMGHHQNIALILASSFSVRSGALHCLLHGADDQMSGELPNVMNIAPHSFLNY